MCRIDYCDDWVDFGSTFRKARQVHTCGDCRREILPGERYRYSKGISDGFFQTIKECAQCVAASGWLNAICHGYLYTGIGEELREHWDEEREFRCLALGKLCIGHQRKWRDIPREQVSAWTRDAVAHAKRRIGHVPVRADV